MMVSEMLSLTLKRELSCRMDLMILDLISKRLNFISQIKTNHKTKKSVARTML